jgi:DNA-binding GntR family transcriptional regulator
MKQEIGPSGEPSRLVRELMPRLLDWLRQAAPAPGTRLTEQALARALQVSRTPIRALLEALARDGIAERRESGGFVLRALPEAAPPQPFDLVEAFSLRIARDRVADLLPAEASEADLMRRYGLTRPLLLRVLNSLAEVALAERKPGHGWTFSQALTDPRARQESYEFRLLIEPAALLATAFALPAGWIEAMRRRHDAVLRTPWTETGAIALFEMNAAFHEGLVAASGNRFFLQALQQQTRLRRFANYDWSWGHARVVASCTEHLEILDQLDRGEREIAAALMRRHLERAATLPPVGPRPNA